MSAPAESVSLKRTPLYPLHREPGARLIDFAGWEMPIRGRQARARVIEMPFYKRKREVTA